MNKTVIDIQKDLKSLRSIIHSIEKYNEKKIFIQRLLADIENGLTYLITIESSWKQKVMELWGDVDVGYAVSQDPDLINKEQGSENSTQTIHTTFWPALQNDPMLAKLSDKSLTIIEQAIVEIARMVQDMLQDLQADLEAYLRRPDTSVLKKAIDLGSSWLMCPLCTDTWQSNSSDAMIICPKCTNFLHNPLYKV